MGLLSKLFGKPDPDDFANIIIKEIKKLGERRRINYSRDDFTLIPEGDGTNVLSLHNAFDEYCIGNSAQRKAIVQRWARVWFETGQSLPELFDDAKPNLLPRIRERAYYELIRLRSKIDRADELVFPHLVFAEHLAVGAVIDLPETIAECAADKLKSWNVKIEELLPIARENLWRRSNENFDSPIPGLYVSPWQDNHDCSRLFLHDLIWQLKVKGDHVAMVPNRDTLIVTGSEDAAGLEKMAELANEATEQPRFMLGHAFRLDGKTWVPYLPPKAHPSHYAFRLLQMHSYQRDADEQKAILEELNDKNDIDVFVGTYMVMQNDTIGEAKSFTTWTKTATSLLPKAEKIGFTDPEKPEGKSVLGFAAWDDVIAVAGDLLKPQGYYPERYLVDDFPSSDQLTQLKLTELP